MKSSIFQVRAAVLLALAALVPACGRSGSSSVGGVAGPPGPGGGGAAVVVQLTGGATTTEAGGSTTISIALATDPTDDVTVTLSLSDNSEAQLSDNSLTFSPGTATTPQVVTVTGKDDADVDGDIAYQVVIDPVSSSDLNYDTLDPADIDLTNTDDEVVTPGIVVTPTTASGGLTLLTSEFGQSDTFRVRLGSTLSVGGEVTVTIAGLDTDEGTLSTTTVVFDDTNAQDFQTVTVTGIEEASPAADGDDEYILTLTAANTGNTPGPDDVYDTVATASVVVLNIDRDGLSAPGAGGQSAPTPSPGISSTSSFFTEFEIDDPSVVMNGSSGNQFEIWFRGRTKDGVKFDTISRATSLNDPTAFGGISVAVSSGGNDWDRRGVGKPSVVYFDFDANAGTPNYLMFLAGRPADYEGIGTATPVWWDLTGANWNSPSGPIFSASGVALDWDEVRVFDPMVVLDAGTYHMWYTGEDANGLLQIGYATAPMDPGGLPGAWTRQNVGLIPALPAGAANSIDAGGASAPTVVKDGSTYHMWYTAYDPVRNRKTIAYASSTDPDDFSGGKFPVPIVAPDATGTATWCDENVFSPAVVKDGALYRIWYAGSGSGGRGIGYVEGN